MGYIVTHSYNIGRYIICIVARAPPRFVTIRVGTVSLSFSHTHSLFRLPVYPLVGPRLFRQIKSQILLFHYII